MAHPRREPLWAALHVWRGARAGRRSFPALRTEQLRRRRSFPALRAEQRRTMNDNWVANAAAAVFNS